jgi:hypothetical protein
MARYSLKDCWRAFSRRMLLCFVACGWTAAYLVWRDEHDAGFAIGLIVVAVLMTGLAARSWWRAHKRGELNDEPNVITFPTS